MPEDNRLNLDVSKDQEAVPTDLLKDVVEATKAAKQRQAEDKARDAQLRVQARDRTLMRVIVVVAAVFLFVLAYWLVFKRSEAPRPPTRPAAPRVQTPVRTYQPAQPYVRPRPAPPPSEPVRRNPAETYDEGPGTAAM